MGNTGCAVNVSSVTLATPLVLVLACYVEVPGNAASVDVSLADAGFGGTTSGLGDAGAGLEAGGPLDRDGGASADAGSCDGVGLGTVQSRVRYAEAQVLAGDSCSSEMQQRSCTASGWSNWSGSFAADRCSPAAFRSCGAVAHGASEQRRRFAGDVVSNFALCFPETQTRVCNDGTLGAWSGSARFERCTVSLLGICNPIAAENTCVTGTVCPLLRAMCVGTTGHACGANGECQSSVCVAGSCASGKVPSGGACDETSDCAACTNAVAAVCSAAGVCTCGAGAGCSANNQCAGTCAAQLCVTVNTTCDNDEDCNRDTSKCVKASGQDNVGTCRLKDKQVCTSNAQCEHVCRPIDENDDFVRSECADPAKDSFHCDENADCEGTLVCRPWPDQAQPSDVGTHCQAPGAAYEQCDESLDCVQAPPSTCSDNQCVPTPGVAEP
jgi:hypothetical protein